MGSGIHLIINNLAFYKAVVGGPAGPAMAGPLYLPKMVLAGPHFWPNIFFAWAVFSRFF